MNGRVYDYNLGRFLSVDPFIQSPGNSQSMNPYSYLMNSPLAGTDPTGYRGCAASRIQKICDNATIWSGGNGNYEKKKNFNVVQNSNGKYSALVPKRYSLPYKKLLAKQAAKKSSMSDFTPSESSAYKELGIDPNLIMACNSCPTNQLPTANFPILTFYSMFPDGMMRRFAENFPHEHGMFKEYASSIDMTKAKIQLTKGDTSQYESVWRGFRTYIIKRSPQIYKETNESLITSLPQYAIESIVGNMVKASFPGKFITGVIAASDVNTAIRTANALDVHKEHFQIITHREAQYINENLYKVIDSSGYKYKLKEYNSDYILNNN